MNFIAHFFAGTFLCNSLPHLVAGLQGHPFPTPFAKPSGVGDSSPLVNFLWGSMNLAASVTLLIVAPFKLVPGAPMFVFAGGFLVIGVFSALHFGNRPDR